MRRKYGLSIDNLLSAQVVCADGQVRRHRRIRTLICSGPSAAVAAISAWSLRSPFSAIRWSDSCVRRCVPSVEDAENVYRQFRDWAKTAPDEISTFIGCTTLPASEHTPPEIHNTPFIVTAAVFSGDPEEA